MRGPIPFFIEASLSDALLCNSVFPPRSVPVSVKTVYLCYPPQANYSRQLEGATP